MDFQYNTSVWSDFPLSLLASSLFSLPEHKNPPFEAHLTDKNPSSSTANGGQYPSPNYVPPSCPPAAVRCGTCHRVDNIGPYGPSANETVHGSVVVEIVDACPAGDARNYCKTDVPADERCGSDRTNSLDIDVGAYKNLTGGMDGGVAWDTVSLAVFSMCGVDITDEGCTPPQSQPNLRINITLDVPCHE